MTGANLPQQKVDLGLTYHLITVARRPSITMARRP